MKRAFAVAFAALIALAACAQRGTTVSVVPDLQTSPKRHVKPHATPGAIVVNAASPGPVIDRDIIGVEGTATEPWMIAAANALPISLTVDGDNSEPNPTSIAQYELQYVQPYHADLFIRGGLNSPACTGPATAAQWASYVSALNVTGHYNVKLWQIGHFPFANDDSYCGPPPAPYQDPGLYGLFATEFSKAMKAVDPTIQTGVSISGYGAPNEGGSPWWDTTVLKTATYDFVSFNNGGDAVICPQPVTDACELGAVVPNLDSITTYVRGLLTTAGKPNAALYQDEVVIAPPNQSSVSIVDGLLYGLFIAESMHLGYSGLALPLYGGDPCFTFTPAPGVYGWQNYGTDRIISQGINCGGTYVPEGTLFPGARAAQLAVAFGRQNEHMLPATVTSATSVRAYAATQGTGYALFLFNLDETNSEPVTISISKAKRTSFTASETYYDKSIYDQSQYNVWAPQITQSVGTVGTRFSLTLTPWSMTVVQLK